MAKPTRRDIDVYKGDNYALEVTVTEGGSPKDLTGATWLAQVRDEPGANGALLASFSVDSSQQASGLVTISLTDTETAALPYKSYWDLQRNDTKKTLAAGVVYAADQVTV